METGAPLKLICLVISGVLFGIGAFAPVEPWRLRFVSAAGLFFVAASVIR
jgi:hypothetical protein